MRFSAPKFFLICGFLLWGSMPSAQAGFGTNWSFTLDSQCTTINCNTSGTPLYGTWTAYESVTGATFSNGTYTRPSPGFIQLNVPAGASAGSGSWKTGNASGFSIFAIEVPSVGIISDPLLSTETQPIVMVEDPTCPTGNFNANFLAGQWLPSVNDMTSSTQMATGYLNWDNSTNTFSISKLFNVKTWTDLLGGTVYTLSGSSCSAGTVGFSGAGDRAGSAWLGQNNSIIYQSQTGHTFYGFPSTHIESVASLFGNYAAIRFDSYGGDAHPIAPMTVTIQATGSGTSRKLSNPFVGTVDVSLAGLTETLSIASINSPRDGMLEGIVSGAFTAKVTCVVGLNLTDGATTKNAVFCAGQSPQDSSSKSPFNLFMVSVKDYPGGIDKTYSDSGQAMVPELGWLQASFMQPDGKLLVFGPPNVLIEGTYTTKSFGVARFMKEGGLDTSFGVAGKAIADDPYIYSPNFAMDNNGKILVGGGRPPGTTTAGTELQRIWLSSA